MSVKTEAKKSASEPSLFSVFGPKVSDQDKAVNQRAAELSMGDMAQIMGQSGGAAKASWEPVTVKVIHSTRAEVEQHNYLVNYLNTRFIHDKAAFSPQCRMYIPPYRTGASEVMNLRSMRDISQTVNIVEQARTSVLRLLEVGVDGRSITATINYSDPQTGLTRSQALDSDANLLIRSAYSSSVHRNSPAKMKTRKSGRFIQSTATKK